MPVWLKILDSKHRTTHRGSSKILVDSAMSEDIFTRRSQAAIEVLRDSEF